MGCACCVTPFPQEEFNPTDDRKTAQPSLGVTCFDCHVNGHTTGQFHLTPDVRPQQRRFRLDTTSLRGVFHQQIHGSKRSLRSVEDFTEFEQRTAYFNGDPIRATKKGMNILDRIPVSHMAQFQNMLDFPPAPKLDTEGRLIAAAATESERRGRGRLLRQGAVRRVPPGAALPRPADARSARRAVRGRAAAGPDQDVHPPRDQGQPALSPRRPAAHARGHGGVLQPGPRPASSTPRRRPISWRSCASSRAGAIPRTVLARNAVCGGGARSRGGGWSRASDPRR